MTAGQTQEEKQRILLGVVSEMKEHTAPSLSQICGQLADESGELVGSGTIVRLRGKPYLLTAQHVVSALFAGAASGSRRYQNGSFHSVGDGARMASTGPRWYCWPPPHDIAVAAVDPADLAGTTVAALQASRFASTARNLDDDLYFVHGWPSQGSRFSSFAGPGVVSRSQPYGGWLTADVTWPLFDANVHVAVTYPMTEIVDELWKPTNLQMPGGLSGSLLWKTNRVGMNTEWTPERAAVVGLVHRFDQDAQCLIATRIEYVKGLLLTMLREEFAFFRWLDRGAPPGDDWADWFSAERDVTDL